MDRVLNLNEIHIRDPYVLAENGKYYLYGSNGETAWSENLLENHQFSCYWSDDLVRWHGPKVIFEKSPDYWGKFHFWAPEVHFYGDKYYMLASFKAPNTCRGTAILTADNPIGPFRPLVNHAITPHDWESLDGTLYIDERNNPWLIFCHEWLQVHDGTIAAARMSRDLCELEGQPEELFSASSTKWSRPVQGESNYVTDGPFIHKMSSGQLVMIWSSFANVGYALGQSRSISGNITGPWEHNNEVLYGGDGGHGMIFRSFGSRLLLAIHSPNNSPCERPVFLEINETCDGWLTIGSCCMQQIKVSKS